MFNHFEYDYELCNKKHLFFNIVKYCQDNNINPFKLIPFTVIINTNYKESIDDVNYKLLEKLKNVNSNINNYLFKADNIENSIDSFVKFENKSKSLDFNNLNNNIFNLNDRNLAYLNIDVKIPHTHVNKNNCNNNAWIIKPVDLCGGKLIKIINNLNNIDNEIIQFNKGVYIDNIECNSDKDIIEEEYSVCNSNEITSEYSSKYISYKRNSYLNKFLNAGKSKNKPNCNSKKYRSNNMIIQKYIQQPLLYNGRKFDIRIWTLIDHHMKIYIFKEGHLKTCSVNYKHHSTSKYIHLTNYSLQKKNPNFNKYEEGNEVSFRTFQDYLYKNNHNINVKKDIMPKIINIIKITYNSIKNKINKKNRNNCFLIAGYDFIIDINYNVWLLEVNKNPGLSFSSNVIKELVPRMVDDCLKITLDKVFKCFNSDEGRSKYTIEGYSDYENLWMEIKI